MTTYQMTTITSGTRLRKDHTTFADVVTSVNAGITVQGSEMWEAPADGSEVRKGDKWMLVFSVDGIRLSEPNWMAYIHKGAPICRDFRTVEESPEEPPVVVPAFPDWYILEHPDGTRAKFDFVEIVK